MAVKTVPVVVAVAITCLTACAALALMLGVPRLGAADLIAVVTGSGEGSPARLVVWDIRAPRFVLGLLGGAALAVAGALLQTALRNPLAGPELLGVSASAALVVAITAIFGTAVPLSMRPLLAGLGGVAGGAVVLYVARTARDPVRVILLGACLAALCNSMVIAVLALGTASDVALFQRFVFGSLTNRTWDHVGAVAPWIALALVGAVLLRRPLEVLRLGDDVAGSLGLRVRRIRGLALAVAAVLTASVVAVCGQVAFVALLAPHLVRTVARTHDDRTVLPLAAVVGGLLLTAADLAAREVMAPRELPVGTLTAVVGGIALLAMLRRLRGRPA